MLPHLVEEFDTILLMKVGRMIEPLKKILAQLGLLSCATYVSHASMEQQYKEIIDNEKYHEICTGCQCTRTW